MIGNTRPFKRALVHFSGMRSCGDNLKFLIRFYENLEKRRVQLGLILIYQNIRCCSIEKSFEFCDKHEDFWVV